MNKVKKCIPNIIEILLGFSIVLAILSVFFKCVIFNKYTYTSILEKNNVYGQVKDVVYDKIDAALKSKNINYDIKGEILTEDDIKREADSAITGIIEYLEAGENNVKQIDTQVYKQRVADILHSTIGSIIKPSGNELSFNDDLDVQNTSCIVSELQLNKLVMVEQNKLKVERLMTRDEAEAKVRELLKQKGLTEEQAIEKARQKGITEEQALKILAGYGITIDEQPQENGTKNETSGNNQSQSDDNGTSSIQKNSNGNNNIANTTGSHANEAASNSKEEGSIADKNTQSAKSQLDMVENKLLDEANSSIQKEVEKIDLNKILESNKFQKIAKITSIIYKMSWLFMSLPIIFMAILISINRKNLSHGLKQIGRAFLLVGLILSLIFVGVDVFKVYEKIYAGPVYFKEVIFYTIKYFSTVLAEYGIITFLIGLLMFVPTIIKKRKTKQKIIA